MASWLPNLSRLTCSGVLFSFVAFISAAILPISVSMPVDLAHPGVGIVLFQQGLGLRTLGAAFPAGGTVMGAFAHDADNSFFAFTLFNIVWQQLSYTCFADPVNC